MDYKKLLDITLELEGLLMMKLSRGADAPARTDELISEKIAALTADPASDAIAAAVELEETEDAEPEQPVAPAVPAPEPAPEPAAPIIAEAHQPQSINDVTKAFTLNDKFRFRRELFRNSDAELTETLNVLQAMESLDEAEDYLYNDLAWDPENPEVKAFIALIAPCYSR